MTDRADSAAEAPTVEPAIDPTGPDWGDPPRVVHADTAPVLTVDGFAGPLDWLLDMARARKIDLARLSIAALIEAFAAAMDAALAGRGSAEIGRWAAWTVLAASLTELWSRLMLPADAPEARAAAAEAETLRRQLLDRARMREAADWLERRPQLGHAVFSRGAPEIVAGGRVGDTTALLRACLVALAVPDEQVAAWRPRPPPLWSVTDALGRIREKLPELPDGSSLRDYLPAIARDAPRRVLQCRAAVASTLIAGLELARTGELALGQADAWTPVQVRRGDSPRADDPAQPGGTA